MGKKSSLRPGDLGARVWVQRTCPWPALETQGWAQLVEGTGVGQPLASSCPTSFQSYLGREQALGRHQLWRF